MPKMLIAIPVDPEYDETETPNECDEWEMLMRDLRDDVARVHDLPGYIDANPTRELFSGRDAWVYRFDVDDELCSQLTDSAYAQTGDLIISRVD